MVVESGRMREEEAIRGEASGRAKASASGKRVMWLRAGMSMARVYC